MRCSTYLKYPKELNAYAPAHYYYFDTKKHKIVKLAAVPRKMLRTLKILHGPYKKLQNNKVLETGYYALGTKPPALGAVR